MRKNKKARKASAFRALPTADRVRACYAGTSIMGAARPAEAWPVRQQHGQQHAQGAVANTIRLAAFARRREIGIMRLVGASTMYIALPFLLEALVTAVLYWSQKKWVHYEEDAR